jgi:hypothetical protein
MTRRWQDSDVRSRPELWTMATDYLTQYTGDFPYLVEARRAIASGNQLRTSVVRGVLNCMMGDSKVINMPEPIDSRFDAQPRCVDFDDPFGVDQVEDLPKPLPPPKTVYLNVRWKMTHGVVNHKAARALHLIDPKTSVAKWWTDTGEIRWQIGWACKSRAIYFSPIAGQIFLLRPDQVKTTLRIGCLTMSPAQFNGHEMKGSLVRDWRECKQCLLFANQSSHSG